MAYGALAAFQGRMMVFTPPRVGWLYRLTEYHVPGPQGSMGVKECTLEVTMQHARPNRLRRAMIYAALAVMLGAVSLTLSQCTMVGDSLTGVDLSKGRPTTCIKQCNDLYKLIYDQEQKRHAEEKALCDVAKCAELPPAEQQACIDAKQACQAAESARHEAAKAKITQDKVDCQNNCHTQGTGSAG
jgi:hypothetical protein